MTNLFIVTGPPYGSELPFNAFRLADWTLEADRVITFRSATTAEHRAGEPSMADPAGASASASLLAATVGYTIMILVMTATPLAMQTAGFGLPQAATIMQWHVLGMFAPSFVTGHLIVTPPPNAARSKVSTNS